MYIYSYISDVLSPSQDSPMQVATAEKSPSLPVLAFPLCMLDTTPAPSLPPIFVHMVHPSHSWPPSYITTLNTALKHLLHKLILSHSHHMPKPSQCAVLHPLNHTTIHSVSFPPSQNYRFRLLLYLLEDNNLLLSPKYCEKEAIFACF